MSRTSRPRAAVAAGLTLGATAASIFLAPTAFAAGTLPALDVPESAAAGSTVTFSGEECFAGSPEAPANVVVYVGPTEAESEDEVLKIAGKPDADGKWSAFVELAADAPLGEWTIDAVCEPYVDSEAYAEYDLAMFQVTAATPAGSTPAPSTTPAPTATPSATPAPAAAFKPGAIPNTPGVSSTTTDKTTGAAAAPGQKVVKVLKGFKPFEKVTVVLHSAPVVLGEFTADANGVVTVEFTVPAGTPLGNHTLAYDGNMGTHFEEPLQLTADGKALAYTGASIAMPLIGGSVLLAAGAGAMVVGRRRRSAGAAQA
ncbi:hypothetical protein [Modestobacter sp. SSW1-42]|uniref:hypothetical protein n=1 Tax=Modestobacter sp. SSW1-42 TaxID=596372 RepID=UPI00398578EA